MNELSQIFNKLDLDTEEVLEAAETKWNFLSFRPGLVGGHCIGVDPYYLTHKAESEGYSPRVILSGRELNDRMAVSVAENFIDSMHSKSIPIEGSRVLVMGLTFKENCPDVRNSKVFDLINFLHNSGVLIDCYDPWVDYSLINDNGSFTLINNIGDDIYDGVILAVAHDEFKKQGIKKIKSFCKSDHTIFDLKYLFSKEDSDFRL